MKSLEKLLDLVKEGTTITKSKNDKWVITTHDDKILTTSDGETQFTFLRDALEELDDYNIKQNPKPGDIYFCGSDGYVIVGKVVDNSLNYSRIPVHSYSTEIDRPVSLFIDKSRNWKYCGNLLD